MVMIASFNFKAMVIVLVNEYINCLFIVGSDKEVASLGL